jgi:predicted transcriptional regulator
MPESMNEQLQQDMTCEGLLGCFHGLTELDRRIFGVLVDAETALTIDRVAEEVDRERSTAYRSVQRLVESGFVQKEQINYEQGGYYHVFRPADADRKADEMQRLLNEWYAQMGQLVQAFRDQYGDLQHPLPQPEDS